MSFRGPQAQLRQTSLSQGAVFAPRGQTRLSPVFKLTRYPPFRVEFIRSQVEDSATEMERALAY